MYRLSWCIMLILRILILIFVSRVAPIEFSVTKNPDNYGPYNVKWYNYVTCRGPRSKDAAVTIANITYDEYGAEINYNSTFFVTTKIDEVKIVVWSVNGEHKKVLWNYKVTKPCQHFLITSLFQQYLNMHNCVVKAGTYLYKSNYTEAAILFFGKSFFYGDYMFKINVFSKQGNIACYSINALIFKKV